MSKSKINKSTVWSDTSKGLRLRLATGIWWVNATINGENVCADTGTTVRSEAHKFLEDLRAAALVVTPGSLTKNETDTLAFFIAQYRSICSTEDSVTSQALTVARKLREVGYVQERWAEYRGTVWSATLSTPSPLALEDPRKLTIMDLLAFQKRLADHYKANVANRYMRVLCFILQLAEDGVPGFRSPHHHRLLKSIPLGSRGKVALPSVEEFCQVLAALRAERNNADREDTADLAEGLAYSGLRIDEARRLRVCHVRLNAGVDDKGVVFGRLVLPAAIVKGKKKDRGIPLRGASLAVFTRLVLNAGPDGVVFKANACNRSLKRACAQVGCMKLSHHKLRHWFATIALEKTGDPKQVSEWLGHQDGGKLVMNTYTHTRDEREALCAAKLDMDYSPKAA